MQRMRDLFAVAKSRDRCVISIEADLIPQSTHLSWSAAVAGHMAVPCRSAS